MRSNRPMPAARNCGRGLAFTVALLGVFLCSPATRADNALDNRLDTVVDRWIAAEKIVGAVVLVARDGRVVYQRAAGMADREAGIPVTRTTIFRLASMSKQIVCATALALVAEGKLSLDDTVAHWLPYFTPRLADGRQPDITIRQLMTHTAGLSYAVFEAEGNAYQAANIDQGLDLTGLTLEEALRRLASVPLFYEPGHDWRYSLAIDVLGGVIEKASGMTLPVAVARYVTGPLQMRDTGFRVTDPDRLAVAYRDGESRAERIPDKHGTIPVGINHPHFSPARALDAEAWPSGGGGMSGTADDYLQFLEAIRTGGGPVFGPEFADLFTHHAIGTLRAWSEGEGWGHSLGAAVLLDPAAARTPQQPGTWQWGGILGTHWFVDPGEALTVVVMTNTAIAGVIGEFPAQVRDAIYDGLAERGER